MTTDKELSALHRAHLVTGLSQRELAMIARENVPAGAKASEALAWLQDATDEEVLDALRHSVRQNPDLWMILVKNIVQPGIEIVQGVLRDIRA